MQINWPYQIWLLTRQGKYWTVFRIIYLFIWNPKYVEDSLTEGRLLLFCFVGCFCLFSWLYPYVCGVHAQSCPTLCDPTDCSPPGSSVHEILQARILEWVAISCSSTCIAPQTSIFVICLWCETLVKCNCSWKSWNDAMWKTFKNSIW